MTGDDVDGTRLDRQLAGGRHRSPTRGERQPLQFEHELGSDDCGVPPVAHGRGSRVVGLADDLDVGVDVAAFI